MSAVLEVSQRAVGLEALNFKVEASRKLSFINPSLQGRQNQGIPKGETTECSQRCLQTRVHFISLVRLSLSSEA